MSTRIIVQGRTQWASSDWRVSRPARAALNYNKAGVPVNVAHAIPAFSAESPFRGEMAVDPDDGIAYRLLQEVSKNDGWLDALWWCAQMEITPKALRRLADQGLVDCAKEHGSAIRWVRCRDMPAVLASLRDSKC